MFIRVGVTFCPNDKSLIGKKKHMNKDSKLFIYFSVHPPFLFTAAGDCKLLETQSPHPHQCLNNSDEKSHNSAVSFVPLHFTDL